MEGLCNDQYHAIDAQALEGAQALAQLMGCQYRVSGSIVAVMVPDSATLDMLLRTVPRSCAVVDV